MTHPGQVDDVIHLDKSGWSLARIGEHLRIDPTTVFTRRRERGMPPVTRTDDR